MANTPPGLNDMTGVPWLGHGRGQQPQAQAVGHSRGLPLSTDGPGIGRARGFPTPGDTLQGRGATIPTAQPMSGRGRGLLAQAEDGGVGRARGLLLPAAEPKVVVPRGAVLASLEAQHGQTPPCESVTQHLTETTTAKEVWITIVSKHTYSISITAIKNKSKSFCLLTGWRACPR